ncbi:MAG: ATP synthase F0 subcomplex subunit OSCP atp5 [Icmadophila ericetorum]|nr:ATP synthase F0 subcomplex subunit OSCP atp5 [Icmadophila ericetorum]
MLSSKFGSAVCRSALSGRVPTSAAVAIPRARTYATPATPQDTKPPIAVFGIDGTYANALYTAAAKTSTLEPVSKSILALSEVFKRDPKLTQILHAPTLSPQDKQAIITELQKHMGSPGADKDTVKNFLKTLADNNRLGILAGSGRGGVGRHQCAGKFGPSLLTVSNSRGMKLLIVDWEFSQKLDTKTLQRLETAVSKSEYSQGKKLKVIPKVNPEIKGGLIVEIGDRTIDLSVSSKITRMNKLLNEAI